MKRILFIIAVFIAGVCQLIPIAPITYEEELFFPVSEERIASDTLCLTEWDIFLQALIYVESRGNSRAVGTRNDVGILQITPIYVAEVNRILREERYTLSDRTDPDKSVEMFCVLQDYHNPNHDIGKAIRLHNPGAGEWYKERIVKRMNQIREEI